MNIIGKPIGLFEKIQEHTLKYNKGGKLWWLWSEIVFVAYIPPFLGSVSNSVPWGCHTQGTELETEKAFPSTSYPWLVR